MMSYRASTYVLLMVTILWISCSVGAQEANVLGMYARQSGLIEGPKDLPFKSVEQALKEIPSLPNVKLVDRSQSSSGFITYTLNTSSDNYLYSYMVFMPGSPIYPAVARRQMVLNGDHVEVQTTMLCSTDSDACKSMRSIFERIDQKCGVKVKGCPGHIVDSDPEQIDLAARLLIPPVLRQSPREEMQSQPMVMLARKMTFRMKVAFACQDVMGSIQPYQSAKKSMRDVTILLGHGAPGPGLSSFGRLTASVEASRSSTMLAEELQDAHISHAIGLSICKGIFDREGEKIQMLEAALKLK
jgi:hypothetical protein